VQLYTALKRIGTGDLKALRDTIKHRPGMGMWFCVCLYSIELFLYSGVSVCVYVCVSVCVCVCKCVCKCVCVLSN